MWNCRVCLIACALGAILADVATAGALEPGSRLCLYPVELPVAEKEGDERRSTIEKKLVKALVAASFTVADPQAVRDLAERVRKESGGFIDPVTGQRDEPRYRRYRAQLAGALRGEHHCDAQLVVRVVPVRAHFEAGTAKWDGVTDQVSSTGRVLLQTLGGFYESGWVGALSLWLHALDLEGNDLAFRSAGVETLVELALLRDQDLLPEDRWLMDTQKLDAAIQSALGIAGASLREQGTATGVDAAKQRARAKSR